MLALGPVLCIAQVFQCRPSTKHECSAERCTPATDFQHAESFSFSTRTRMLSACLWTNCYEGKAVVWTQATSLTAVGQLKPAHPGNGPLTVTLTIDKANAFVATWGASGTSVTIDMGVCESVR